MVKTIADRPGSKEADLETLRRASKVSLCARLLIEAGLRLDDFQLMIDNSEKRERLVRFWRAGCAELTTSQAVARGIMGPNMYGVEEMFDCLGIAFSQENQLSGLDTIPFPAETLRACKETHILFPGYPKSIMQMRDFPLFSSRDGNWYDHKPFAKDEQVQCRWYLLRKSGISSSSDLHATSDTEVIPRACEVVFGLILAHSCRDEHLFTKARVACYRESKKLVYIGFAEFQEWGISIGDICDVPEPPFASMVKQ